MFEQQQNKGKSASLAEKYANAVDQLSDANDRAAHAEHDLQVDRITRQDLIDEEVARQVAAKMEVYKAQVEAQYAEKAKELAERGKALGQRELDIDKKAENIAQTISEQVRHQMSSARTRFEKTALSRLADMFEMFMQAFVALGDKDSSKGQELLQQYQQAAKETQVALTEEIKEKLDKVEANNKSKSDQIASLVRMIFVQKRERVVFSDEERESIYDGGLASVEFTDEEKKRYQECRDFCEDYRKRKAMKKLLNGQKAQKGHGRNPIPDDMPRLPEKVLWPVGYLGMRMSMTLCMRAGCKSSSYQPMSATSFNPIAGLWFVVRMIRCNISISLLVLRACSGRAMPLLSCWHSWSATSMFSISHSTGRSRR